VRGDTAETERALRVTDGLLSLLRVRPLLGEPIRIQDDLPGAPNRVLLTYGYWQRAFGAVPGIIGQQLSIDGAAYEIAGVLPESFKFLGTNVQLLLPLRLNRSEALTGPGFTFHGVARLRSDVTIPQANSDVARMIPLIIERFPLQPGVTREMWAGLGLGPNVRPLVEDVVGDIGRSLWILFATAGIVLVMASANVTNLLLVRVERRQREFAVRAALGASRGRLTMEVLTESVLLALAGGALGVLFAGAALGVLRKLAPIELPRVEDIGINWIVLLFTAMMSIATALGLGLLPAVRFGTLNAHVLKDGTQSTGDGRGRHRTQNALVVAQIALALVMLIVAGLMIRTFSEMRNVQPGFVRHSEVQTFRVNLARPLIGEPPQVMRTHEQIAEQLEHVPGVVAIGLAGSIAMDGLAGSTPVFIEDRPVAGIPPARRAKLIGPGYFEAMGNPVLAGRTFTWSDLRELKLVAVISENFAREYWGEPAKAIGRRLGAPGAWSEIVGVVGNERIDGLNHPAPTIVYWPMAGAEAGRTFVIRNLGYVVRSQRVGQAGFVRELEQAVRSVNHNLPLANVQTLDQLQAESMAQTSFAMAMLAIAATVALLLALVGIYGIVSYVVAERTHEIGIRMALGAQTGDVRLLFLRHGIGLTVTGIALGLGAVMLLTPLVSAFLYGVAPIDPVVYTSVSVALGATTLLATYLPVWRASHVQPISALRART
jgi:putative ABC transport system permease protein